MRRSSFAMDPLLTVLYVILGVSIAFNVWLFMLKRRKSGPVAAASSLPENESGIQPNFHEPNLTPRSSRKTPVSYTAEAAKRLKLCARCKQLVWSVFKHFENERLLPKIVNFDAPRTRLLEATGIDNVTWARIRDDAINDMFRESDYGGCAPPLSSFYTNIDEFYLTLIRNTIHSFFHRNVWLTLDTLHKELLEIKGVKVRKWILRKVVKAIGFRFKVKNGIRYIQNRPDIRRKRRIFLRKLRKFQAENRPIFYLDETWVWATQHPRRMWCDTLVEKGLLKVGPGSDLTHGYKLPKGKGRGRLIVLHVGSVSGFLEGCQLVFQSTKKGDYHKSMNAELFENWFEQTLLPALPDNAVVVMDNAPYHSRRLEHVPTQNDTKASMLDFIRRNEIELDYEKLGVTYYKCRPNDPKLTKDILFKAIRPIREKFIRYQCDEMAKNSGRGIEVLRLPPHNCDLNPIEEIWSQLKGNVGKKNLELNTFNINDVERLTNEEIGRIPASLWASCVKHTREVEEDYIREDGLMYEPNGLTLRQVDPLLIPVDEDEEFFDSDDEEGEDDIPDDEDSASDASEEL